MWLKVIKAYRYKTKKELAEDSRRVTKDVMCKLVAFFMNATEEHPKKGRRMVKLQFYRGRWYYLPAREVAEVLRELDFEVTDKR